MDEFQPEEIELALSYEALVTVDAYIMPYEADIVRSLLESEKISTFPMDYHTIYIDWLYSFALGRIKVQVDSPFGRPLSAALKIKNYIDD